MSRANLFLLGCGSEIEIKSEDAIRCRMCDFRILYKKRARQPIQYEAR